MRLTDPAGLYPEGVAKIAPGAIGIEPPPGVAMPTSET